MPQVTRYLLALALVLAALVIGVVYLEHLTVDRLLHDDAAWSGKNRADYIQSRLGDELDSIAKGKPPSAQASAILNQVQQVGEVFLVAIYDQTGTLRFVADNTPDVVDHEAQLGQQNPLAMEAVRTGQPDVVVRTGSPPDWPAFYAAAYVPILENDVVTAVVGTYVDQSFRHSEFQNAFHVAAMQLSALLALAFLIPAAAWYLTKRQHEKTTAALQSSVNVDAVTGIANRRALTAQLAAILAGRHTSQPPLAVYCIDLDDFKRINVLHGAEVGDDVLRVIASRLVSVAGPSDLVARLGADEFCFVRAHTTDAATAEADARLLGRSLAAPFWIGEHEIRVTASIGVALAPLHDEEAVALLGKAGLALSQAKEAGPGGWHLFSSDLEVVFERHAQLEALIRAAAETARFVLLYQPLIDARDQHVAGFEALLRLPDGEGGFISPTEFIPVATRIGLIGQIGAWVLKEACSRATTWPKDVAVSVNVSADQFTSGNVVGDVSTALAASGLAPNRLGIEITESVLLQDTAAVLRQVSQLKTLGAPIILDDFGTGYSSLSYLWRFPFDKLKIDRSFLRAFEGDRAPATKIMGAIIALGHALNIRVNVEGVETESVARHLRSLGCDEFQGFYFGPPMPAGEIAAFMRRQTRNGLDAPGSSDTKVA